MKYNRITAGNSFLALDLISTAGFCKTAPAAISGCLETGACEGTEVTGPCGFDGTVFQGYQKVQDTLS